MELQEYLDYFNLTILEAPEVCRNYTKMELIDADGYKYYKKIQGDIMDI